MAAIVGVAGILWNLEIGTSARDVIPAVTMVSKGMQLICFALLLVLEGFDCRKQLTRLGNTQEYELCITAGYTGISWASAFFGFNLVSAIAKFATDAVDTPVKGDAFDGDPRNSGIAVCSIANLMCASLLLYMEVCVNPAAAIQISTPHAATSKIKSTDPTKTQTNTNTTAARDLIEPLWSTWWTMLFTIALVLANIGQGILNFQFHSSTGKLIIDIADASAAGTLDTFTLSSNADYRGTLGLFLGVQMCKVVCTFFKECCVVEVAMEYQRELRRAFVDLGDQLGDGIAVAKTVYNKKVEKSVKNTVTCIEQLSASITKIIAGMVTICVLSPSLFLFTCCTASMLVLASFMKIHIHTTPWSTKHEDQDNKFVEYPLQSFFEGFKYIVTNGIDKKEGDILDASAKTVWDLRRQEAIWAVPWGLLCTVVINWTGRAGAIWFAVTLHIQGELTLSGLSQVIAIQLTMIMGLTTATKYVDQLYSEIAKASKIRKYIKDASEKKKAAPSQQFKPSTATKLLTFTYTKDFILAGGKGNQPCFKAKEKLRIRPNANNEVVGIEGRNGAGKTSVFDLILGWHKRFLKDADSEDADKVPKHWKNWRPEQTMCFTCRDGDSTIQEQTQSDMPPQWLRNQISAAPTDVLVFYDRTLEENINCHPSGELGKDKIKKVITAVAGNTSFMTDAIDSPKPLHQHVQKLSAGQAKLLGIVRVRLVVQL